jgi:DNA polymerase-1
LQNIQKKGDEGKILRSCFIPEVGHKFVIADYSQIELRIAAEMSGDETMLKILNDPRGDIHIGTAAEMYSVSYEEVSSDLRRAAKTINFGLIYGMSVKTLAERLGCSSDEAAKHLQKYRETYPTLMAWLEKKGSDAVDDGYSKTIGGRIRWFPSLDERKEDYKRLRAFYERVGKNHPIQGTSADMTKTSMVYLDRVLWKYGSKMVNTIHDELCVEVPFEHTITVAKLVKDKMIFAGEKFLKKVPVLVDVKIRDCWFKDDGVEDDENGQQLWLIPLGLGENGDSN